MVQNLGLNFPMTTQQWNTVPANVYIIYIYIYEQETSVCMCYSKTENTTFV